jgi:hypothetical protein
VFSTRQIRSLVSWLCTRALNGSTQVADACLIVYR